MQRLARFLHHHSLIILCSFISLCVGVAIASSLAFGHHLIETQALQHSKAYIQTLKTSWNIYHDDVLQRLYSIEGVTVSPQYKAITGGVPTPTAFVAQISQQLQSTPGNPQFFIETSQSSLANQEAIANPFQKAAQEHFSKHNDAFYQVSLTEGYQAFNYAEPLVMEPSCVECHRTLSNSELTDSKAGDIIGFFAVRQPLTTMIKTIHYDVKVIGLMSFLLGCIGLSGSLVVQHYRHLSQKQLQDELEQKSIALERLDLTDALTQIANQRQFSKALNQEWRRVWRQNGHLSLLICDIDYFKQYNEAYGLEAGDQCLKRIAQTIQSQLKRAGDLVARLKEDEFYVLLPETSAAEAEEVAAILLDAIHHLKIIHAQSDVSPYVSISIGITSAVPTRDRHATELIELAQKALYDGAKQAGRNDFAVEAF